MPRVRSLYSRYFSTIGASSLWALAVFWKRAESETISGEDRALLSSSYFSSVWSRRSNMGSLHIVRNSGSVDDSRDQRSCCKTPEEQACRRLKPAPPHKTSSLDADLKVRTTRPSFSSAASEGRSAQGENGQCNCSQRAPLGNHQFAAALFLQRSEERRV